jgi:hypothetical protein
MRSGFLVAFLAGCTSTGSLDLELSLPTAMDLRPTGMQTITVIAQSPDLAPVENTAVIDKNGHFAAGDIPVGKGIQVDVLLRDFSSRLVGVGEAPQLVDVAGDQTSQLTIPVRKPFVYAASSSQLFSYDSSIDARQPAFQGALSGVTSPTIAISLGGDRLIVASGSKLQVVDTATNAVMGMTFTVPGAINDAAPVPGRHLVAVGHASGMSIVDIDSGQVSNASGPSVDRVAVGGGTGAALTAYGLVGRVGPSDGPNNTCSGSSQLVSMPVDAPASTLTPMPITQGAVSDIASSPETASVWATLPCAGKVVSLSGEASQSVDLERAAALAIAGDRVWAVGSKAPVPVCFDTSFNPTACPANPTAMCTSGMYSSGSIGWADPGAKLVVESIPLAGGSPIEIDLPERRETMLDAGDPRDSAHENARVLHPLFFEPLDIVVLPGSEFVAVVTKSTYYTMEFIGPTSGGTAVILPCLTATTGDWLLIDAASSSVAERVRTQCDLTYGMNDVTVFQTWTCADPPAGEQNTLAPYLPTSVGALFGAR